MISLRLRAARLSAFFLLLAAAHASRREGILQTLHGRDDDQE
jgi:hypothetical protein